MTSPLMGDPEPTESSSACAPLGTPRIVRFTIFTRLTLGFLAIMGVVIFLGTYATVKLSQLNHLTRAITLVDTAGIRLTENVSDALLSQVGFEKKYLVSNAQSQQKPWQM